MAFCAGARLFCRSLRIVNTGTSRLNFCTTAKQLRQLGDMFGEARLQIEDATEYMNTIYFAEESEEAINQTEAVLKLYEEIVNSAENEAEKKNIQQTWALKMKQLEAEIEPVKEELLNS